MSECNDQPALTLRDVLAMERQARAKVLAARADASDLLVSWGDEAERLASSDAAEALVATEMLVDMAQGLANARACARVRRAHAVAQAHNGSFHGALATAVTARQDAVAAGERVEAARLLLAQMHPLLLTGKPEEAIRAGTLARDELRACSEVELAARVDINLANVHKAQGRAHLALECLDAAARELTQHADLSAHIDNARGESFFLLDQFAQARTAFASALAHFSRSGGFAAAVVEGNLADVAARQGEYQEALDRFTRAREQLGDAPSGHAARMLAEEGEVFEMLGIPAVATERYAMGIAQYDHFGMGFEALRTVLARGRVLEAQGDAERGAEAFADAASRAQSLGQSTMRALALLQRASTLARAGRVHEARESIDAVDRDCLVSPLDRAMWHVHRAIVAERAGTLDAALADADAAVSCADESGVVPIQADALALRALVLRRLGRSTDAAVSARRGVGLVERLRGSLHAEQARAGLLGRRLAAYEELVTALLADGSAESATEAFCVAEQARSRTLLDRMRQAIGDRPAAGDCGADVLHLREQLEALYVRVARDAQSGTRSGLPEALRSEIVATESRLSQAEDQWSVTHASRAAVRPSLDPSLIQSSVPDDTALVSYYQARGRWMAFVTTNHGIKAIPLECDDTILSEAIGRLGFQLRRGLVFGSDVRPRAVADAMACLAHLSSVLWAPVAPHVEGIARVSVLPYGALHAVPFHALGVNGKLVVATHEVTYAPSAGVWSSLRARQCSPLGVGRTRVVGVPDPAAPCIAQEAEAVARWVGDHAPLLGSAATVERVKECLLEADAVHVACHGFFLPEAPRASGLKLADGWLTARDIAGLERTPESVVLSGCETAATAVRGGDELMGIATAFLGNTTAQLLATLWPIHDGSAAIAMTRLYALSGSGNRESAARAAQHLTLELMERTPHPAHWAPFALIGA